MIDFEVLNLLFVLLRHSLGQLLYFTFDFFKYLYIISMYCSVSNLLSRLLSQNLKLPVRPLMLVHQLSIFEVFIINISNDSLH